MEMPLGDAQARKLDDGDQEQRPLPPPRHGLPGTDPYWHHLDL